MDVAHANTPCRNQGVGARSVEQAFAVEPDPHALAAFDPEIIARQRVALLVAPPFHGDALGAFGMRDHVAHAPPGELHRRAVRHRGDRFDRLRPLEQADRAGGGEGVLLGRCLSEEGTTLSLPPPLWGRGGEGGGARGAADASRSTPTPRASLRDPPHKGEGKAGEAARRRHARHRIFRNMRVLRHEPRHAAQPETRAEPVDEMRKLLRMVGRRRGRSARGRSVRVASAPSRTTS